MTTKSKTEFLTYIEETPKHHDKLVEVIQKGVRKGIASAKKAGYYITYAKGSEIVREYPNGKIEVIGKIENTPLIVEKNAQFTLR